MTTIPSSAPSGEREEELRARARGLFKQLQRATYMEAEGLIVEFVRARLAASPSGPTLRAAFHAGYWAHSSYCGPSSGQALEDEEEAWRGWAASPSGPVSEGEVEAATDIRRILAKWGLAFTSGLNLPPDRLESAIRELAAASSTAGEEVERLRANLENARNWNNQTTSDREAAWKDAARSAGVCMSCGGGSIEPCTDCLGTGWNNGENPWESLKAAETQLATEREARERLVDEVRQFLRPYAGLSDELLAKIAETSFTYQLGDGSFNFITPTLAVSIRKFRALTPEDSGHE